MTRRSGLGRGLDALLPEAEDGLERRGGLVEIGVDSIVVSTVQPRRSIEPEALSELAESIRRFGLLQPLLVRPSGEGLFELIAGERRWRAAREAGLATVAALVVETDEAGSLERALVENLQRADLNPIDEAAAYRELIEREGLTHEQLAERLGRNRVTITNALRLLDLPPSVQALLVGGRLSAGHGRALLGLAGNPFMERLAQRVAGEQLSVRETEEEVRRYQRLLPTSDGRGRAPKERPPQIIEAQRLLADLLQTRVRVEMGKRKGKIVVDFVSLDELERLLGLLLPADSDQLK